MGAQADEVRRPRAVDRRLGWMQRPMSYRKVLSDPRCRLCRSGMNLCRYFLIPGSKAQANTIAVCVDCLDGEEVLLDSNTLHSEEVAYVLKHKGAAFLGTLRIGGQ